MVLEKCLQKSIQIRIFPKVPGKPRTFGYKHTNAWRDPSRTFRLRFVHSSEGSYSYGFLHISSHATFLLRTGISCSHYLTCSWLSSSSWQWTATCQGPAVMGVQRKPQTTANLWGHRHDIREWQDILGTWAKCETSDLLGLTVLVKVDLAQVQVTSPCFLISLRGSWSSQCSWRTPWSATTVCIK